jgi:YVTN family beta-propeller protein
MKKLIIFVALAAGSLSLAAQPYAYLANYYSNPGIISVINTATNAVTGTISVGSYPTCIAFNPNGSRAYVTNFGLNTDSTTPGTVSVIDTTLTPPSVIATIRSAP